VADPKKSGDYFLKLEGIDGESQDSKHKNEMEILSYSLDVQNRASADTGGGSGSGVSEHGDFKVSKLTDKASPKLFQACASGEHIKKAVLTVRKAGKDQQEFLKVTLSDVLISSVIPRLSHDGNLPTESVTLNYAKIEIEYKEQKPDGTLGGSTKGGWDVKARKTT